MQGLISDKVRYFRYQFISQHRESSDTFAFWTNYINMILLLLDYIRAERYDQWRKHLSAVTAMLLLFLMIDYQICAKWCSVYVADINLVEQSSAETLNTCHQSIRKIIFHCMVRYGI